MNQKFATSKILVNFMKKMMFLSHNWYFSVQKALIYYTFNKSHHNSFILLVFSHVANFRYVANFRFLTLNVDIQSFHQEHFTTEVEQVIRAFLQNKNKKKLEVGVLLNCTIESHP